MTPLGQARAHRAWRGLANAPIHGPSDAFYVAMWERDRLESVLSSKLLIELLAPLNSDLGAVHRLQRALYTASTGRYTAPEERVEELRSRAERLKKELAELREQIALSES